MAVEAVHSSSFHLEQAYTLDGLLDTYWERTLTGNVYARSDYQGKGLIGHTVDSFKAGLKKSYHVCGGTIHTCVGPYETFQF